MQVSMDWVKIALPERFAPLEDDKLMVQLKESQTTPVQVSAKGLRRLDTLLLQYLIAAAASWRERGLGFEVVDLSDQLQEDLLALGFSPTMFRGVDVQ